MRACERERERERENELFFFIFFDSPTRIMNRVPKGGGIETFRNSHGRPLVSHATHQLNVNVCLCVRREPDVYRCPCIKLTPSMRTGNKIVQKKILQNFVDLRKLLNTALC